MKIKSIEREKGASFIYVVTFEPNFLEKLFGKKEIQKKYKETGYTYLFGSGKVYIDQEGEELGNGNWIGKTIDKFQLRW